MSHATICRESAAKQASETAESLFSVSRKPCDLFWVAGNTLLSVSNWLHFDSGYRPQIIAALRTLADKIEQQQKEESAAGFEVV